MFTDNYYLIAPFIRNKNCFFARMTFEGRAHYLAGNRAARRLLSSSKIQRILLENGANLDTKEMSFN